MREKIAKTLENITSDSFDKADKGIKTLREIYKSVFEEELVEKIQKAQKLQVVTGAPSHPVDAITAFDDIIRSSRYLKGVDKAIETLIKKFPGEKINIVYAGCGPLAPLVLPLCAKYSPDEISITLVDIYDATIEFVKGIVKSLGFEKYIAGYELCDAVAYKFPDGKKLHLVVTETMQSALKKEAQFAISWNMAGQLAKGGIMIPEEVKVDFVVMDPGKEFDYIKEKYYEPYNKFIIDETELEQFRKEKISLVKLNAENLNKLAGQYKDEEYPIPERIKLGEFIIPENLENFYNPMLTTAITIFEDVCLKEYQSGLTHPMAIYINERFEDLEKIVLYYNFPMEPGIIYEPVVKKSGWFA